VAIELVDCVALDCDSHTSAQTSDLSHVSTS
jgi:hypothetical protein